MKAYKNETKEDLEPVMTGGVTVTYNQSATDRTIQSPTHRFNSTYDDAVNKFKAELPDKVKRWRSKANAKPQSDTKGKITFKQLRDRLNRQFNPKKVGSK